MNGSCKDLGWIHGQEIHLPIYTSFYSAQQVGLMVLKHQLW